MISELTNAWGTTPSRLTLELTERALIEAAAPVVLARMHEMGEKIAIDDFGTGYSSLPTCNDCRWTRSRLTGPS